MSYIFNFRTLLPNMNIVLKVRIWMSKDILAKINYFPRRSRVSRTPMRKAKVEPWGLPADSFKLAMALKTEGISEWAQRSSRTGASERRAWYLAHRRCRCGRHSKYWRLIWTRPCLWAPASMTSWGFHFLSCEIHTLAKAKSWENQKQHLLHLLPYKRYSFFLT